MSEEIKPKVYPNCLGENNVITNLKKNIEESPLVTYSSLTIE